MRVHRLALTAFGPFAEKVAVDLDDVGRDGLFLLWGPTGAGKTTLLDAVVFALYGTVPGARGEEKRLRSDHAATDARTEVSCELTLSGERLRVIRRPEQQRPKKRGAGSTIEQAKLTVQRLTDGGWEAVSTRIDEGSEYLRVRLGLDVHQFCQVVLLPQGDFARFLETGHDRGMMGQFIVCAAQARALIGMAAFGQWHENLSFSTAFLSGQSLKYNYSALLRRDLYSSLSQTLLGEGRVRA